MHSGTLPRFTARRVLGLLALAALVLGLLAPVAAAVTGCPDEEVDSCCTTDGTVCACCAHQTQVTTVAPRMAGAPQVARAADEVPLALPVPPPSDILHVPIALV